MLDVEPRWGKRYKIKFSAKKANAVHLSSRVPRTNYSFSIGPTPVIVVDNYKHLGVVLSLWTTN